MLLASHLILSCYGFWLPNDPRGSWSTFIRNFELLQHGPATKVQTRHSIAGKQHDHIKRLAAKNALKHQPVKLTGKQARAIVAGFTQVCLTHHYDVYACAVLPDHAHLVIGRHRQHNFDQITRRLKAKATQQLNKQNLGIGHSPWSRNQWQVFLDRPQDICRAIQYVCDNPPKAGLRRQHWHFVKPYDSA